MNGNNRPRVSDLSMFNFMTLNFVTAVPNVFNSLADNCQCRFIAGC